MGAWRSKRRAVAVALAAAAFLLPFLRVGGESALRFDAPGMKLHLFGEILWISDFSLVLAGSLFLLVFTLAATNILGRVWCGWLCPQTVLPELASLARISRRTASAPIPAAPPRRGTPFVASPRFGSIRSGARPWRGAGESAALFLLSGLLSFSLVGFFVPPAEAAPLLFRPGAVAAFFLAQWAAIFSMTALLGPRFCRTVCPYSMIQSALFDRDTLVVAFDAARAGECPRCGDCVEACSVGIDIRDGLSRECIACARCIDACRGSAERGDLTPFIAYRGKILRPKAALLCALTVASGLAVAVLSGRIPPVAFAVQWEAKVPGASGNGYRYAVQNRLDRPVALSLRLEGPGILYGEREITVAARSRKTGKVIVRRDGESPGGVTFVASAEGITLREKAGYP